MEDSTKIAITRLLCGTTLLITHTLTGLNSTIVIVALFLLGIPAEYIAKVKEAVEEE